MTNKIILLPGWGQNLKKFSDEVGFENALTLKQMSPFGGWWPSHDEQVVRLIVNSTPLYGEKNTVIIAFSDGARTALRAALLFKRKIAGLVFHSGQFIESDLNDRSELPFPVLVIDGMHDKTRKDLAPWWSYRKKNGTNAKDLYKYLVRKSSIQYYTHPGKHEWGIGTTNVITRWMDNVSKGK